MCEEGEGLETAGEDGFILATGVRRRVKLDRGRKAFKDLKKRGKRGFG